MIQTLLFADGDAELCDIYQKFFIRRGYRVETARNGIDCLEKIRQVNPDVLVLDLELFWGGGEGVLARLREKDGVAGVPVVITATAGYTHDLTALLQPPVVDCLPKPFAPTALLDRVRFALARGPNEVKQMDVYSEQFLG